MKATAYWSTSEAYDASQCRVDWMHILIIKEEKVVAVADTWPIAVTKEHGEIHQIKEGYGVDKYIATRGREHAEWDKHGRSPEQCIAYGKAQWAQAIKTAKALGYELL